MYLNIDWSGRGSVDYSDSVYRQNSERDNVIAQGASAWSQRHKDLPAGPIKVSTLMQSGQYSRKMLVSGQELSDLYLLCTQTELK